MPAGRRNTQVVAGAVFGRLTVIERLPKRRGKCRNIYPVRCRCECGKEAVTEPYQLSSGRMVSCGCYRAQMAGRRQKEKAMTSGQYGRVVEGAEFGRLRVVRRLPDRITKSGKTRAVALCQCRCGKEVEVLIDGMINGNSKSCGCLLSERTAQRNKESASRKGFSQAPRTAPVYRTWVSITNRCHRETNPNYTEYGARGVSVCEWIRADPKNLLDLLGLKPTPKHTIDRYPIHDGHYCCGKCDECARLGKSLNVRWATRKEQSENRGAFNVYLTAFGKTLTRSQWQDLSGINSSTVKERVDRGWSIERALTTPDSFGNCYKPEV